MNHFSSRHFLRALPPLTGSLGLLCLAACPTLAQTLPAFPGAEGAGKYTTGGRGSTSAPTTVLEVTYPLPTRDPIDQRIIQEVKDRTGKIIDVQGGYAHGTPYSTSQVAWQVLNCNTDAPTDTDHDGMPDAYETANGLNPNDASDRALLAANGYPNLENYLNGLVAATVLATTKASSTSGLLQVYPNPALAGQTLTVVHPAQVGAAGTFTIYSFEGRRVATQAARPGTAQTQLDVRQLAASNYLLVYEAAPGAQRLSIKFLKAD